MNRVAVTGMDRPVVEDLGDLGGHQSTQRRLAVLDFVIVFDSETAKREYFSVGTGGK